MAESVCRCLRDGALEGEHAVALTIKDTVASPYGLDVFTHVLAQLSSFALAGKSQSRGIVLVAFSREAAVYLDLLKSTGIDVSSSHKFLRILDCYSDPLGWKDRLMQSASRTDVSYEASSVDCVCKNVRDLDKLYLSILELGKGFAGEGKVRFTVAIDSVSEMLRHASTSKVAALLSNLRGHDQISSMLWLLHSDLHEERVTCALEYVSSIVASVEPFIVSADGQRTTVESLSSLERNFGKGKLRVRLKRRNGRVRLMHEEFHIEKSGINFTAVSSQDGIVNQTLVPKVQFNLELSEKEKMERAKVTLPFEHQGNGKPIQIYDGRRSVPEEKKEATLDSQMKNSNKGEIIYFRDSDDERPDSDEDPDDDLDI